MQILVRAARAAAARYRSVPPSVLYPQLFLGFGWLRAATEKIVDAEWWSGESLATFLEGSEAMRLPFYQPFVDLILEPIPVVIAVVVFVLQLFTGVALVANIRPIAWTLVGIFLNLHFIMAGSVNPSVFYIVLAMVVVLPSLRETLTVDRAYKFAQRSLLIAAIIVAACVPYITTLDPARVIEDPSLILMLLSTLFAFSSWLMYSEMSGDHGIGRLLTLSPDQKPEGRGRQRGQSRPKERSGQGPRRSERSEPTSIETDLQDLRGASPAEIMEAMDLPTRRQPGKPTMTYHEDVESGFSIRDTSATGQQPESGAAKAADQPGLEEQATEQPQSIANFEVAAADDGVIDLRTADGINLNWYSVRCHFQIDAGHYEERITVWQAESFDQAIDLAESEANNYAVRVDGKYLGSCDCFHLADGGMQTTQGYEIYSLVRASDLDADTYLRTFFFTGSERSAEV